MRGLYSFFSYAPWPSRVQEPDPPSGPELPLEPGPPRWLWWRPGCVVTRTEWECTWGGWFLVVACPARCESVAHLLVKKSCVVEMPRDRK
jgi:hypothetical protein